MPRPKSTNYRHIVELANEIVREYQRGGHSMTLRQMYYQFVARGHIPNAQTEYAKLGVILTDARYAGHFPIDGLIDRGRSSRQPRCKYFCSLFGQAEKDDMRASARRIPATEYMVDPWFNQSEVPWLVVEKESLAEIFERVSSRYGCGMSALKGYPSVQLVAEIVDQIYDMTRRIDRDDLPFQTEAGDPPVRVIIYYFGDHDPDGLEIPNSLMDQLRKVSALKGYGSLDGTGLMPEVVLERKALTVGQIRRFNPPPMPAKESSPRYKKYVQHTGLTEAWELDALPPDKLSELADQAVRQLLDRDVAQQLQAQVTEAKNRAQAWINQALGGDADELYGGEE